MTIKSLQDLNTYAQTPITYNDVRTAQVIFDRGATVDQQLTTSENSEYTFPWGINIEDITQYEIADMEYHIDLTNFNDASVQVSWDYLPSHITVTRSNNIWIVSDIRSGQDWLYVRQARVLPPFGFSGLVQHEGSLQYYSDNQDSARNIVAWDVDMNITQVQYFSTTLDKLYTSNTLYSNFQPTTILTDPEDFDPVWDLRIYALESNAAIEEIFSDGSAAEAAWNNTTKQYVITGDTESVNEVLNTLDLETARYSADFTLVFRLANNYTSDIEYQIQNFLSRDFISDQTPAFAQNTIPSYIFGGSGILRTHAFATPAPNRLRDPLETELPAVASIETIANADFVGSADLDTTASIVPNGGYLLEGGASLSSAFGSYINGGYLLEHEATEHTATATLESWPVLVPPEAIVLSFDRTLYSGPSGVPGTQGEVDYEIHMWSHDTRGNPNITEQSGYTLLWDAPGGTQATEYILGSAGGAKIPSNIAAKDFCTAIISKWEQTVGGTTITREPCGIDFGTQNSPNPIDTSPARGLIYKGGDMLVSVDRWGNFSHEYAHSGLLTSSFNLETIKGNPRRTEDLRNLFDKTVLSAAQIPGRSSDLITLSTSVQEWVEDIDLSYVSSVMDWLKLVATASSTKIDVSSWDLPNAGFTTFGQQPINAGLLSGFGNWNTSTITDFTEMFYGATGANIEDITGWNTSSATSMRRMFNQEVSWTQGLDTFNQNLNSWDVSAVTNMSQMFRGRHSFNQSLNSWDTSAVTDMSSMFEETLDSFNITSWDVSSVQNFSAMFRNSGTYDSTNNITYPGFNEDISGWNTGSATDMSYMFQNTQSFDQDISGWDVSNVVDSTDFDNNSNTNWTSDEKPTF
jgi:surface protein